MQAESLSFFRQFSSPRIDRASYRGNELWTHEFSAPAPGGVTLLRGTAETAGVYVFGYTSVPSSPAGALFVGMYSTAGVELWNRDFPPNHSYLRKYSLDGAELWTKTFGDSNSLEIPTAWP